MIDLIQEKSYQNFKPQSLEVLKQEKRVLCVTNEDKAILANREPSLQELLILASQGHTTSDAKIKNDLTKRNLNIKSIIVDDELVLYYLLTQFYYEDIKELSIQKPSVPKDYCYDIDRCIYKVISFLFEQDENLGKKAFVFLNDVYKDIYGRNVLLFEQMDENDKAKNEQYLYKEKFVKSKKYDVFLQHCYEKINKVIIGLKDV